MRKRSKIKRFLALLLTALMTLSLIPAMVSAASETYQKVTDPASFATGTYVMVTDTGYAPGVLDGTWITAEQMAAGRRQSGKSCPKRGVGDYRKRGSGGSDRQQRSFRAAKGGNSNGISAGEYQWKWTFEDGKLPFPAGRGYRSPGQQQGLPE